MINGRIGAATDEQRKCKWFPTSKLYQNNNFSQLKTGINHIFKNVAYFYYFTVIH